MDAFPEARPGTAPIRGRIAAGLMLVYALSAAVALDWRPMRGNELASPVDGPRRRVAGPRPPLPARIDQCERYTVEIRGEIGGETGGEICGTWTLRSGGVYRAAWSDGATATIRVIDFDGSHMAARRVDDRPSGRTGFYEGTIIDGRTVDTGSVRRNTGSESHAGSWTARWEPSARPANTRERQAK